MGILSSLLSALGCASPAGPPALADYQATLSRGRALVLDDTIAQSGRYQVAAGDKAVLLLRVVRGKSMIARDQQSEWSVAVELPAVGESPAAVTVDSLPTVARVAGEDVVYLARGARGTVQLADKNGSLIGTVDLTFAAPDRDLLKLGSLRLSGAISGRVE